MTMTTLRTQLRRQKPAAVEDEVLIVPPGLIFDICDLSERLTPRRVLDRFRKLGFRHAFQVQCDGITDLFVGFLSTSKRLVEDKPSRAIETGKRRLLPVGRINPEPVGLS